MKLLFMDPQQSITDFDIQALVDNELPWEKEKHVLDFLQRDPKALARYQTLRRQKKLLGTWWNDREKV